jgi:ribonucleoside-diphosphate reductase alpha chain
MEDPDFTKTYPNGDSGETYTVDHSWAKRVYWQVIEQMLTTGEPGFSVDTGENHDENLRNACTEVTSEDDNDICNLGSINLARVDSIQEFDRLVELGTAFLLCGTLYSEVPYPEVAETRTKNRRLGLGLMGVYEWLALRGKPYAPDEELGEWLEIYTRSTEYAIEYAGVLNVSPPVKTRAMAPNGTIAIIAGTTSSIEPMFAPATKRKYRVGQDGQTVKYQYTIDAIAERLAAQGLDVDHLESAYDLARDPERRVLFQAWFQQYVDHGISSTINLPNVKEHAFTNQEFGEMLFKYLPSLRGITVYPDGARGGQPLTAVSYEEAAAALGVEYSETSNEQACVSGVCGI